VESEQSYRYKISTFHGYHLDDCKQLNQTVYNCSSLQQAFNLLSQNYSSVDIILEPGSYNLTTSHNISNLDHIQISSKNATIKCGPSVDKKNDSGKGIAFIRVTNLVIKNVIIIGCGMKHISTKFGKEEFITVRSALFIQNSTNISLYNMSISNSSGIGLLMYDTNGTVNIIGTSFINNSKLFVNDTAGGGGIYIHFTNCTPGLVSCDPSFNAHNKHAIYLIDKCSFQNNSASYHSNFSGLDNTAACKETFLTFGSGGGISVWFYGNANNNSFHINRTSFVGNTAGLGGGINIHSKQNAEHNQVKIAHCSFTNNTSIREGGGAGISMGYEINQEGDKTMHNKYIVDNCLFKYNQAVNGVGGGMALFGSREPHMQNSTNNFAVLNSNFTQNKALFGSAIEINRQYFECIPNGAIFTLIIENCTFINNSLNYTKLLLTEVSNIGAVATSSVNIRFKGSSLFSGNNSTALAVEGALIEFYNNSQIKFCDNNGVNGGGILLTNNAWIKIYQNCSVFFIRNTALHYGGAIYVKVSTHFDYVLSHVCFFSYYIESALLTEWNFNFAFINNTAGQSKNSVFVTTLKPCFRAYKNGFMKIFNKSGQVYHYPHDKNIIITAPHNFTFSTSDALAIIPGEVFDLTTHLKVVDEQNQEVKPNYFIATCIGSPSPSPYVMSLYHLTNGSIQIAGNQGETCHLQLQTHEIATKIQIAITKCPPGFTFNDNKLLCECKVEHTPAISSCDHFQAYLNRYYWIGYHDIVQNHTKSFNIEYMLYSACPYRFCYNITTLNKQLLPRHANQSTLDRFVCYSRKRTGVLCAKCIDGYSVTLNSPAFTCHRCRSHSLGILYLFLSYILPVTILFYFIMAYNIRMTTGPISAYLFFSQTISSQFPFIMFADEFQITSRVVIAIYSISNLNFFHHNVFSYCLFSSAGTVDILTYYCLCIQYCLFLSTFCCVGSVIGHISAAASLDCHVNQ